MMFRLFVFVIFVVFGSLPAAAQVQLGSFDQFQTRFGTLAKFDQGNSEVITFNGQQIALEGDYYYEILGAWGLADADHDWALVQGFHGGNMCGRGVTVLRISATGVTVMGELGTCTWQPHDIRVYHDAFEMDTWEDTFRVDYITYRFDATGASATRHEGAFAGAPMAGAGPDVTRWLGVHFGQIVEDAGERARFLSIMSQEELESLVVNIAVGGSFERQGDWLLAAGCMAHACNTNGAVVGIRISTGEPRAIIHSIGSDRWLVSDMFGETTSDPVWGQWVTQHGAAL